MPAPDALEKSQIRLFRSLKNELRSLEQSRYVKAYEKSFLASLPRTLRPATKAELLKAARRARVVLVGDFHSFRQSQKGFLRLLRDCKPAHAVIALECVKQSQQASLDHYLAGHLTVEELREDLDFERAWPFPWPNYREILECARREGMGLLALNVEEKNQDPGLLKARDEAAAEAISARLEESPASRIFVLYGELHLARTHLPASLRRRTGENLLIVHQNETSLFWQAPRSADGQRPEVLRLRKDEYCVLNSVPWVKLRSYLDWLEGSQDEEDCEDGIDVSGSVLHFARVLGETIGIEGEISEDIETIGPEALVSGSFSARDLSAEEKILLRHSLRFQRATLLPKRGWLLLPSLSTNALTEAGSLLLWRGTCSHAKSAAAAGNRLLAQFLVAYLGSKILNPKRKCNEVADIETQLERKISVAKRSVLQRSLTLLRPYVKVKSVRKSRLAGVLEVEAIRLAGYVLANRIFLLLQARPAELAFVRDIYRASNASEAWANHLLRAVARQIKKRKLTPKTKNAGF